jgi:hypothetical protein
MWKIFVIFEGFVIDDKEERIDQQINNISLTSNLVEDWIINNIKII